jgi:hypothetical protein
MDGATSSSEPSISSWLRTDVTPDVQITNPEAIQVASAARRFTKRTPQGN